MASLIYYPGFSVEDERWLKYALLYLDEIKPIVPNEHGWRNHINNMTRYVHDETDLLNVCTPTWRELMDSSNVAVELIQGYIDSPDVLANALHGIHSQTFGYNILDDWKQSGSHDTLLFREKFAYKFFRLCDKHSFCHESDDGLMIPSQLANIYMSILANEIGTARQMDVITDDSECNRLVLNHEVNTKVSAKQSFGVARTEIEYYLPCDLDAIPLSRIIDMRNDRDFRAIRSAYSRQIDQMIKGRESYEYRYSSDELLYTKRYLKDYMLKTCDALAIVLAFAVSIGALKNGFQGEDVWPLTLSAYIDYRGLRSAYEKIDEIRSNYTDRRLVRKYIAEIKRLNRPTITR